MEYRGGQSLDWQSGREPSDCLRLGSSQKWRHRANRSGRSSPIFSKLHWVLVTSQYQFIPGLLRRLATITGQGQQFGSGGYEQPSWPHNRAKSTPSCHHWTCFVALGRKIAKFAWHAWPCMKSARQRMRRVDEKLARSPTELSLFDDSGLVWGCSVHPHP